MKGPILTLMKDLGALNLGRSRLFRVVLMATARCPLKCTTCGIWRGENPGEPAFSELEEFFTINSLSWLNLTGGEIFLRKDLEALFRLIAATQKGLALLSFPTSGVLVDKTVKDIETGLKAGLSRVFATVSFDGGRAAHDTLRGVAGTFQQAAETFKSLRGLAKKSRGRLKVFPGLTFSAELMDLTEDPVGDLVNDLGLDGPHEVHVNLAHASSHYYQNDPLRPLPASTLKPLIRRLARARRIRQGPLDVLERLYLKGAERYLDTGISPLPCKACMASVFIDAEWTAHPCTIFDRPLGDLREIGFDLSRLAAAPAFREAREAIRSGDCPGCWTPCEAYTALTGSMLHPAFYGLFFRNGAPACAGTADPRNSGGSP